MVTRVLWALVLALVPLGGVTRTQQPAATGLIVGRVVDAASGAPVASAEVRLDVAGRPPVMGVLTGADGHFVFSYVAAGRFTIIASRPGYLEGAYGRRRPGGSRLELALAEGERRGDVTIPIWPAASISGRISDDRARPLPGATVFVVDGRFGSVGSIVDGATAVTDGAGEYRIDGLPPGRYLVGVICRSTTVSVPPDAGPVALGSVAFAREPGAPVTAVDSDGASFTVFDGPLRDRDPASARAVFVSTWLGDTTTPSGSDAVDLITGDDRTGVDITMATAPARRVAGRVTGSGGGHALVRLFPPDHDLTAMHPDATPIAATVAGPDGRFAMQAVPAGPYLLQAYGLRDAPSVSVSPTGVPVFRGPWRPDDTGTWALQFIDVGPTDAQPLVVSLRPGLTVTGTLAFAAPAPAGAGRPIVGLGNRSLSVDPGGAFEFTNVRPGTGRFGVSRLPSGPTAWMLIAVAIGGRDVTGRPYRLNDDAARVTLTVGPSATVTGRVQGDGPVIDGAAVVLFPADREMWWSVEAETPRQRLVRTESGTFTIQGVPPGEYFIAAVDDAALADWPAATLLGRLSAIATRIRLEGGDIAAPVIPLHRTFR